MNEPAEFAESSMQSSRLSMVMLVVGAAIGGVVGLIWSDLGGIDLFGFVVALTAAGGAALGVLALTRFFAFVLVVIGIRSAVDGFGLDSTSGLILTPSTAIGALFLVSASVWLVVRWRTGRLRPVSPCARWAVGFGVATMLSVPLSIAPGTSLESALKVLAIAMMVMVLEQLLLDDPRRLTALLGVAALSLVIPFVAAIFQVTGNRLVDENIDVERINATFIHPNALATYCTILLAYALAVHPHLDRTWRRVAVLVAGLSGFMLLFSYARASWIGALVAVVVVALLQDRRLFAVLGIVVVLVVMLIPSVGTRLSDLNNAGEAGYDGNSLSWRFTYWGEVLDASSDRRVIGTGLGTTPLLLDEELDVHNSILQSFTETGVIGLIALLGWMAATAKTINRALRRPTVGLARGMVIGSAAAATNVGVQLLTENHLTAVAPLFYLAIGLGWAGAVAGGALSGGEPAPGAADHPVPSTSATG